MNRRVMSVMKRDATTSRNMNLLKTSKNTEQFFLNVFFCVTARAGKQPRNQPLRDKVVATEPRSRA